jgi:hypothetical protein
VVQCRSCQVGPLFTTPAIILVDNRGADKMGLSEHGAV